MGSSKAPSAEGVHAMFFHKYLDVVGEETSRVCLKVLNEDANISPLNKTLITLIPKVTKPKCMSEFGPISLCTAAYKIIAKVLANKLKKVLDIISPTQATFCPWQANF